MRGWSQQSRGECSPSPPSCSREGPVYAAVPVASHGASQGAVHGVLAALLARERSGRGQRVETSLLQGILPYDLWAALLHQLLSRTDQPPPDPKLVGGMMPTLNYHPVLAKDDRWIQCGNLLEHLFLLLPGCDRPASRVAGG